MNTGKPGKYHPDKKHDGATGDPSGPRTRSDLTLILVLLAIFLFHSPFTSWWASLGLPWYCIFIFWLLLIGLSAFNQIKTNTNA